MSNKTVNNMLSLWGKLCVFLAFCFLQSCSHHQNQKEVDNDNDRAYHFHYLDLDSALHYANHAYLLAQDYADGRMEAMNNQAFVDIAKMHYLDAEEKLRRVLSHTDNQIELYVANVQMMRLCQRRSDNKDFYYFYWHALSNRKHIRAYDSMLNARQRSRILYADTEMVIILSAYLYYVGQIDASVRALAEINESGEIQKDTAQLLNYFYNLGTGSYIHQDENPQTARQETTQKEIDYLLRCYFLALRSKAVYWQANALQGLSEHLQNDGAIDELSLQNLQSIRAIAEIDLEADDDTEPTNQSLARNMAMKSVELFAQYGDTYQTAGALRTLSDSYFNSGDSPSAILCLLEALERDTLIMQSPSMVSSINEKLSINYAAIDDKQKSYEYRDYYLEMHDNTRQDMQLLARKEQLSSSTFQLNAMITIVCAAIIAVVILLLVLTRKRRRFESNYNAEKLLAPLQTWKTQKTAQADATSDRLELITEQQESMELMLDRNTRINMEQRAKMSLINSITPLIDRMAGEINCIISRREPAEVTETRLNYISELADRINDYNDVLTDWIQLRKGELSLHIESFPLQELFDIVQKGRMSFALKGIELCVHPTTAIVKADKALTLFMINTIADNARKATPEGGKVTIEAAEGEGFVDISVSDTGIGMSEEALSNVFNHKPTASTGHGFGLMNCKGIIDKYRKVSSIFAVCRIMAESRVGEGSVFRFRLPRGVARMLCVVVALLSSLMVPAQETTTQKRAEMFVDSVFFANLQQRYDKAMDYSDSARTLFNIYYRELCPEGRKTLLLCGANVDDAAELSWLADSLDINFNSILDLRNETAVAALALHEWDVYQYNNQIYSRLYREYSSDPSILDDVNRIQHSGESKTVSIVLLVVLLISLFPLYYVLYYRHKIYYRDLVGNIGKINSILLGEKTEEEKLELIRSIWSGNDFFRRETIVLDNVVRQILHALEESVTVGRAKQLQIELAEDELKRLKYENDNLHVQNNVLDNCFSALKHETMYFPARIRQMAGDKERSVAQLYELVAYYKALFSILSMQAQHLADTKLRWNHRHEAFLRDLLSELAGSRVEATAVIGQEDSKYTQYLVEMPKLVLTDEELANLFTPLTKQITCLIIKQIVREVGEATGKRGCGVRAERRAEGGTNVYVVLPTNLRTWK